MWSGQHKHVCRALSDAAQHRREFPRMPRRVATCADCGKRKETHAHGLCKTRYRRRWQARRLSGYTLFVRCETSRQMRALANDLARQGVYCAFPGGRVRRGFAYVGAWDLTARQHAALVRQLRQQGYEVDI
jgi:hypothetical protein